MASIGRTVSKAEIRKWLDTLDEKVDFAQTVYETYGAVIKNAMVDGRIHRFKLPDSRKENGWYILSENENGTVFGAFGDWASDTEYKFCSKKRLSQEESMLNTRILEEKRKAWEKESEEKLQWLRDTWIELEKLDTHPYLERKSCLPHGDIRKYADCVAIPMYDREGNLRDMQKIFPDGKKNYVAGLSTSNLRYTIEGGEQLFLCEGYATGASIHEATGATVVIAFDAGNMVKVAKDYPGATVVADNDESKTGENKAKQTGLRYILIPEVGMDANDYAQAHGLEELRELLCPTVSDEEYTWSVPLNDWLDQPAPIRWLIKGWIPRESTITIFGKSGSGKTFVALDMMLSITTGQDEWFGHKVRKGNVYYMCGEGYAGMRGRAKAWAMTHGLTDLGNINVTESAKDLINQNDLADAMDDIDRLPWVPDLIVIDTLNRFYSGDENAADKIHAFLESIQKLEKRYKCSVMIVHHTGVSEEAQGRARGSGALRAAMEVEFSVENEQGLLTVTQRKQKDIELLADKCFQLESVDLGWTDEDGDSVKSAVIKPGTPRNESAEDIARFLLTMVPERYASFESDGRLIMTRDGMKDMYSDLECKMGHGAPSEEKKRRQTTRSQDGKPTFRDLLVEAWDFVRELSGNGGNGKSKAYEVLIRREDECTNV